VRTPQKFHCLLVVFRLAGRKTTNKKVKYLNAEQPEPDKGLDEEQVKAALCI
jgi:hypothetical protein